MSFRIEDYIDPRWEVGGRFFELARRVATRILKLRHRQADDEETKAFLRRLRAKQDLEAPSPFSGERLAAVIRPQYRKARSVLKDRGKVHQGRTDPSEWVR